MWFQGRYSRIAAEKRRPSHRADRVCVPVPDTALGSRTRDRLYVKVSVKADNIPQV